MLPCSCCGINCEPFVKVIAADREGNIIDLDIYCKECWEGEIMYRGMLPVPGVGNE